MNPRRTEAMETVHEAEAEIRAAMLKQAQAIAEIDRAGWAVDEGIRSTQAWLSDTLNVSPHEAKTRVVVARGIERRTNASGELAEPEYPATADAVESGQITFDRARTIIRGVEDLPPGIGTDKRTDVEYTLATEARCATPNRVRVLASQLRHVVDQDGVLRDEEYQVKTRELHLATGRDGTTLLRGRLDRETGAKLRAVLEPLAAPRPSEDGQRDPRSAAKRNADALANAVDLLLATDELPASGGTRPRIVATIDYQDLTRAVEAHDKTQQQSGYGGTLDPGAESITAASLRRLACDAEILPVVLGGDSVPLDVGRAHRTAPPHLRSALLARDGKCSFPSCDHPPGVGEAHHVVSWLDGGETSLHNMTMLCGFHHRIVHTQGWRIEFHHGRPYFTPPRWKDPNQEPRAGNRPRHQPRLRSPGREQHPAGHSPQEHSTPGEARSGSHESARGIPGPRTPDDTDLDVQSR